MPAWLGQLGMQAASTAVDAGLGLLLQGHNDRRQLRQQGKLGQQQLGLDIQKMQYQQQMQKDFWDKTNYGAQMEHMKKSGLNPAMLYGMGGGGGTTVGGGAASVSAPMAPQGGGEILGLQMINAQRGLIEAQTKNVEADTAKKSGVDTEKVETEIQSLTQGIQNQKAVEALTRVQTGIAEVEQDLKTDSYEDVLNTIRYTARQAEKQLNIIANESEISDQTKDEKIALVQGELIGIGIANELRREQVTLTEEQTKKVIADVKQGWKSLSIQEKNALTNWVNANTGQWQTKINLKEYTERARNNEFGNKIAEATLGLQKMVQDVPESTRLTANGLIEIFKAIMRVR